MFTVNAHPLIAMRPLHNQAHYIDDATETVINFTYKFRMVKLKLGSNED